MTDAYRFKINTITTNNGFSFNPSRLNILIGANNCGKTLFLREIHNHIIESKKQCFMVHDVKASWPNVFEELCSSYLNRKGREQVSSVLKTVPTTINIPYDVVDLSNLQLAFKKGNSSATRVFTAPLFESFLITDNRLQLLDRLCFADNNIARSSYLLTEAVYFAGAEAINQINHYMVQLFNKLIFVSPYNPGFLEVYLLDEQPEITADSAAVRQNLLRYPLINEQGDGLRSIAGIICTLVVDKKPVFLIDEPEMSLPPAQAYQFGKIIHELISPEQQLFVSTHSADFLRGILDGSHEDEAQIIHLARTENQNTFNLLDNKLMSEISSDPLLSSSHILDGLFYKAVVGTEGDSDERFYNAAFQRIGLGDDVCFVRTNNKQTLKFLFKIYAAAGIKLAIITDIDILRNNTKETGKNNTGNSLKSNFAQLISAAITNTPNTQLNLQEIISDAESIVDSLRENPKQLLQDRIDALKELISDADKAHATSDEQVFNQLAKLRNDVRRLFDQDPLSKFKKEGREVLAHREQELFDQLLKKCQSVGVFIVPVGELESWLPKKVKGSQYLHKNQWIELALKDIRNNEHDMPAPLHDFMLQLKEFLTK